MFATGVLTSGLYGRTLVFIFLLFSSLFFSAEPPPESRVITLPVAKGTDIRFARISFSDGPSHSRVGQIVQDDQGFIWFGSHDGLRRYDGYSFREYRHNPSDPNSLSGSYINTVFKDRSGKLWVASDEYLECYDPASERFTRDPSLAKGIEGWVWQISQDSKGMLWLATHAGLVRLDPATWKTVRYKHAPGDPTSLSSDLVTAAYEQKDGTFWVATTDAVDIFDRESGKVTQHFPLPSHPIVSLQVEIVGGLLEDHAHTLWVTYSYRNGLARVDRQRNALVQYAMADADPAQPSGIRAIQEDDDGALWLGTVSGGIVKLDAARQHFTRYRNDPRYLDSLSSDQIVALYRDRDRNIWVGTTGGGVDRFTYRQLPFQTYKHASDNPNSLESDYTTSVFEDSHGDLWVGSKDVLTRIDRKSGHYSFLRRTGTPGELSSTWVVAMAEDRSGDLWLGTLSGGLNRYDRQSGKFTVYRHLSGDPGSLSHDNVLGLYVDRKGRLWAGTEDGVSAFEPESGAFRVYRPQAPAWLRRYRAIDQDTKGALWLGSLGGGLQRLDPATGTFTIYRQGTSGLSSDQVNAVHVDRSGVVWAGTQNGLNQFDPATGRFTVYYEREGLSASSVNSILEDEHGDLWLSTGNGLSRFNPVTKSFRNYYVSDGLLGNEFYNYANAYRSPAGDMFFNSYAGVISFSPDRLEKVDESSYIPPVVLTNFQLFGKPVRIGPDSLLKESAPFLRSLVLSHSQNIFSFEFAALSYSDPARNRYRYRLEGLESEWNETDSRHRSVTYTTLPPGQYTFRVQGRTSRGPWNLSGATVNIEVLPPWWSTWWFRTLCAVLILAALLSFYEFRLRQVAGEFNMRLEERVGERTRIARELHDTLLQSFQGLMLLFQSARNLLPERPLEAAASLEDALVRADQALTEGRDAVHNLRTSTMAGDDLAQALTSLGEELGTQDGRPSSASFHVLVEGAARNLHPILRDEVYGIAREALRNAFHHSQARRIEAEISYGAPVLRLRVRDDGVGVDPNVLGQGGRAGHWGLPGMYERAERIGARLDVWSRPGAGTEVELSIPGSIAYGTSTGSAGFHIFRKKGIGP